MKGNGQKSVYGGISRIFLPTIRDGPSMVLICVHKQEGEQSYLHCRWNKKCWRKIALKTELLHIAQVSDGTMQIIERYDDEYDGLITTVTTVLDLDSWVKNVATRTTFASSPGSSFASTLYGKHRVVFELKENQVVVTFVDASFSTAVDLQTLPGRQFSVTMKNNIACFVASDVIVLVDLQKCAKECRKKITSGATSHSSSVAATVASPRPSNGKRLSGATVYGQYLYIQEAETSGRFDFFRCTYHKTDFIALLNLHSGGTAAWVKESLTMSRYSTAHVTANENPILLHTTTTEFSSYM